MLPVALHVTDMDKFSPEAQSILASKEMRNLLTEPYWISLRPAEKG